MSLEKIPVVGKYVKHLKDKFNAQQILIDELYNENLSLRFKIKALSKEKINVVFVCHRPAVWGSLKTVYESMKADDAFNVKIVTIPNKKQLPKVGFNHEFYESEGAEQFWTGDDVISGYDYKTGEWIDLKTLNPDYVCFQQPYNVTRPECLKSWNVARYARIFYVAYASNFIGTGILEDTSPSDYVKNVSLMFNQNQIDYELMKKYFYSIDNTYTRQFLTGFPRYDNLETYINSESEVWSLPKCKEFFRVIWTPRWCTNEDNCHFFDYKDKILDYCGVNKDVDFVFRPHPQAFSNWISSNEMTEVEVENYKNEYFKMENTNIDTTEEYLSTFYSSDCMITDVSSIVAEYFLTGKPIIYCHRKDCFNEFSRKLAEGFYWVHNWNELRDTLNMLKSGNDPLKEKRQQLIKNCFYIPELGAGQIIKDILRKDFCV